MAAGHFRPDGAFGFILLPKFQYSHFFLPCVELVHPSRLSSLCPKLLYFPLKFQAGPYGTREPREDGERSQGEPGSIPRDPKGIPRESLLRSLPRIPLGEHGEKIPPDGKLTLSSHCLFLFFFPLKFPESRTHAGFDPFGKKREEPKSPLENP